MNDSRLLSSHQFDANELLAQYPPVITVINKAIVFKLGLSEHYADSPIIGYTRWAQMELPRDVHKTDIELVHQNGFFSYPSSTEGRIEWHVNFAHEDIFGFYGGPLFAQDEMQVAEPMTLNGYIEQELFLYAVLASRHENHDPSMG